MRSLAGLSLQPSVRVGSRNGRRVRGLPLGRRPTARLGQAQLGQLWLRPALGLAARFAGDRLEARPQAPERRVRRRVEAVDRKVAALDQPVLLAQRDRAQEQPLEHVAVGETLRLRLRDRLMRGQPLAEPVAEKEAQIKPQRRHPQQLPHRPDPLQRPRQHQLQKHRRIDRRSAPTHRRNKDRPPPARNPNHRPPRRSGENDHPRTPARQGKPSRSAATPPSSLPHPSPPPRLLHSTNTPRRA